MIDPTNSLLTTDLSSLKVYQEGTGVVNVPALAGAGATIGETFVSHVYGSDLLLLQVATNSGYSGSAILPWQSNTGKPYMWTALTNGSFGVYVWMENAGGGHPAMTVNFTYRLLIP